VNVEVHNLTKCFGRFRAVDRISFSFDSGHVFGFVGPNGAGKTTTLRMLATLLEPSGGDALIDGVSIRECPDEARRLVGFVPDTLPAHNDITVHEYLDFFARAYGLKGHGRNKAVADIEAFTGLDGFKDKVIKALSKGMKQRVSVGRALVHNPPVLLMDEPAAGLDPRARVQLRELLGILAEQGKAILVSSHILTELTEICTGVVIIERGRILETGTLKEVHARSGGQRELAIRCLDKMAEVRRALLLMPDVREVRIEAGALHAMVTCAEEACSGILSDLVTRGFRLIEFRQEQSDLEDLFMRITTGDVQ